MITFAKKRVTIIFRRTILKTLRIVWTEMRMFPAMSRLRTSPKMGSPRVKRRVTNLKLRMTKESRKRTTNLATKRYLMSISKLAHCKIPLIARAANPRIRSQLTGVSTFTIRNFPISRTRPKPKKLEKSIVKIEKFLLS